MADKYLPFAFDRQKTWRNQGGHEEISAGADYRALLTG
jgi:hypothetical protein